MRLTFDLIRWRTAPKLFEIEYSTLYVCAMLGAGFGAVCGSRLWHEGPDWDVLTVKGGSLDQPVDLRGAIHIWTSRRLAGVIIPDGAIQFSEEPV